MSISNLPGYLHEPAGEWRLQKAYRTSSVWTPAPENAPQCIAYELARSRSVMQMGFGGQAGGGKSEYPQLTDMIERGNELFPTPFISGEKKHWRFDGRLIRLRHAQYEQDWKKYQGQSYDFIGFDEAAEFLELQIRYITGWLRSVGNAKTLLLLCFNPPTTPEGEWIVRMFAPWIAPDYAGKRAVSGEIRWFARMEDDKEIEVENGEPFADDEGNTVYPISRTFIPASRHDNPYLGEQYERQLDNLPEPLRSMIRDGDFTISSQDDPWQVIPTNWVLQAQQRWREGTRPDVALRALGVDVARGGDDQTAMAPLYGAWFDTLRMFPGAQTPDGQRAALQVLDVLGTDKAPIYIDVIGWGASAYDHLKGLSNTAVIPVNNAEASARTDKSGRFHFSNIRAASYWALREALDPASGEAIALPDDRDLRVELCAARYKIVGGRIQLELKDDIKKRLKRSPDRADAVVLAWWGTLAPVFQMDWV
jgi:hypothetical protein